MIMASGAAIAAMMRSDNMKKSYDGLPLERLSLDPRDNEETFKTCYGGYYIAVHYLGYSPEHHGVVSAAIAKKDGVVWHFCHLNDGTETRRQVAEWLIDYVRRTIDEGNVDERHLMKGYPRLEQGMVLKDNMVTEDGEAKPIKAKPTIEIKRLEDYER